MDARAKFANLLLCCEDTEVIFFIEQVHSNQNNALIKNYMRN